MTANFSDYQLLPIFFISVGVIFVSTEIGRWLGTRAGDGGGEQVRTLEAAVLGLLALIIAFTFAMALSRYEARRDAVLSEANAVGTTALRARLLPEPHNAETLRLLRDYVKVRLDAAQRAFGAAEFDAAIARSGQIQEALWQQAMAVAAKNQDLVPTGLFIDALNKMIDEHEKRLTAFRNHVPNVVLLSLYGVAMVAGAFSGYAGGVGVRSARLPVYAMIVLICAVILLILDLDRPSAGFIRTSQQPMIDTAANIAKY
jgi:hypothetical protein